MKTNNRIGLEILSKISTREFNLLRKYDFQEFKTIENGLSFFSFYNEKLIFVEISEQESLLSVKVSLDDKQINGFSSLETLPMLLTSQLEEIIK